MPSRSHFGGSAINGARTPPYVVRALASGEVFILPPVAGWVDGDAMAGLRYEVTIQGRVGPEAAGEFAPFEVVPNGATTTIRGSSLDQPALHALFQRLQALGLILVSVTSSQT
jgi:hypothetical protein